MLRWLTRLFRQREAAEAAPAEPPPPAAPPAATTEATASDSATSTALVVVEDGEIVPAEPAPPVGDEITAANDLDVKETCPTCGRTSVFAGPPGQRFCTYCALRGELFEASAAASSE